MALKDPPIATRHPRWGRCRPAYVGVVAQIEQILKQKPKRINDFKEESETLGG